MIPANLAIVAPNPFEEALIELSQVSDLMLLAPLTRKQIRKIINVSINKANMTRQTISVNDLYYLGLDCS